MAIKAIDVWQNGERCWRSRASRGAYWPGLTWARFDLHFLCVCLQKKRKKWKLKTVRNYWRLWCWGSDVLYPERKTTHTAVCASSKPAYKRVICIMAFDTGRHEKCFYAKSVIYVSAKTSYLFVCFIAVLVVNVLAWRDCCGTDIYYYVVESVLHR